MSTLVSMLLAAIFQMSPVGTFPIAKEMPTCTQATRCENVAFKLAPNHLITKKEVMVYIHSEKV